MKPGGWQVREIGHHDHFVRAVVVTPDRKWAVSADEDRQVWAWPLSPHDLDAPGIEFRGHTDAIYDLVVLADSSVVTASWDGDVRRWDIGSGCIRRYPCGRSNRLTSVAADLQSDTVVCGDELGMLHEFVLSTGDLRQVSSVHEGRIRRVRFGANKWWSVGDDGRVVFGTPGVEVVVHAEHDRPVYDIVGPITDGSHLTVDARGSIDRITSHGATDNLATDGSYLRVIALRPGGGGATAVGKSGSVWVVGAPPSCVTARVGRAPASLLNASWLDPRILAVVGRDGTAIVLEQDADGSWIPTSIHGHTDHVFALATIPERGFVSGGFDGRVLLWHQE